MLKKIVIARHADYIHSGEKVGNGQGKDLADRLGSFIGPESIVVLTSNVDRAWLTAKPICRKFGLQHYIESDILHWIEPADAVKAPQALELIEQHAEGAEIIIVITHLDYLNWLPAALAEKHLGIVFTGGDRGYARGWVIDIETKTIEPI